MAKHGWNMDGCPSTQTGEWTRWHNWSGWGSLVQVKCQIDSSDWVHVLVAEAGESRPDDNHIHVKYRTGKTETKKNDWVLADVKIDRVRMINRGELLNKINAAIGTRFTVQDD